jgi:hypothetical protein
MKKLNREDTQDIALIMEIQDGDRLLTAARLLKDFKNISPVMVASYMICLYEVFEELVSDEDQIDFQKNTFTMLKKMLKNKENYMEVLYIQKNNQEDEGEDEDE